MRVLIQKVKKASVSVNSKIVSEIKSGLLIFVGISKDFSDDKLEYMVRKILTLKLFDDLNIIDSKKEILVVSQFTLFGRVKSGTKIDYSKSKKAEDAKIIYDKFVDELKQKSGIDIKIGVFRAMMEVNLINDGPTTILLEK